MRARTLVEESLALARATRNDFQIGESLSVQALLTLNQGDTAQAWAIIQEGIALCRRRFEGPRDEPARAGGNELARAMYGEGWQRLALGHVLLIAGVVARLRGNHERAADFYEESLTLFRQHGDIWFAAQSLSNLGLVFHEQQNAARARTMLEEALNLRRALGDRTGVARSLNDLGDLAFAEGDLDAANASFAEELAIVRDLGDRSGIADALLALGRVARRRGDAYTAGSLFVESLAIRRELGHRLAMPNVLDELAELADAEDEPVRALRLAAAADALREAIGSASAQLNRRGPDTARKTGRTRPRDGMGRGAGHERGAGNCIRSGSRASTGTPTPKISARASVELTAVGSRAGGCEIDRVGPHQPTDCSGTGDRRRHRRSAR